MKLIHKDNYKQYIIGLLSLIAAIISYPLLPDQIPVHFNTQGVADNYGSPLMVFLFPALILGICILAEITRHAEPKRSSYALFEKHYYMFFFALDLFLFLIHLYIITYSLELITFNITNIMIVLIGILFLFIGNVMPKFKQNYFMGIRTPWTIANDQVWYDTHRFAGKLWFVLGIAICICGFLPSKVLIPVLLAGTLGGAFAPMIYSYVIFKHVNTTEE